METKTRAKKKGTQQVRHIYANIENILKFEQCISVYDREKWDHCRSGNKEKEIMLPVYRLST